MQIGELVRDGVISIKTGPFGTQLKAAEYQKSGTPVLNVKNLGYGSISKAKLDYVGSDTVDRLSIHLLKKGDIVFGRKGAVDRHAFIDKESDGWMQGSDCIRMRIESDVINPKFLSYYFLTNQHKAFMISMCSHGTTMASLNQKILEQIEIPYPERQYQDRVVDMLEWFDKKIKVNDKINENLLQQAGAVFNKFYNASPDQKPFTSLIDVLGGGTPKTGNPDFWDGPIPFFTPKDVGAPYTFQTEKYITESGLAHCNSRLYQKDTTFVTARGTVGKVSLAGTPMAMNQSCYALASEATDPLLVYFYVLKAVASLKHKASGAIFDAIVTRDFDSETINILSDDDSKSVLSIIRPIMDAIHNNSKENMQLVAIRDSLLPKLMSGELNVYELDI